MSSSCHMQSAGPPCNLTERAQHAPCAPSLHPFLPLFPTSQQAKRPKKNKAKYDPVLRKLMVKVKYPPKPKNAKKMEEKEARRAAKQQEKAKRKLQSAQGKAAARKKKAEEALEAAEVRVLEFWVGGAGRRGKRGGNSQGDCARVCTRVILGARRHVSCMQCR